jgi:hypothetical protein
MTRRPCTEYSQIHFFSSSFGHTSQPERRVHDMYHPQYPLRGEMICPLYLSRISCSDYRKSRQCRYASKYSPRVLVRSFYIVESDVAWSPCACFAMPYRNDRHRTSRPSSRHKVKHVSSRKNKRYDIVSHMRSISLEDPYTPKCTDHLKYKIPSNSLAKLERRKGPKAAEGWSFGVSHVTEDENGVRKDAMNKGYSDIPPPVQQSPTPPLNPHRYDADKCEWILIGYT